MARSTVAGAAPQSTSTCAASTATMAKPCAPSLRKLEALRSAPRSCASSTPKALAALTAASMRPAASRATRPWSPCSAATVPRMRSACARRTTAATRISSASCQACSSCICFLGTPMLATTSIMRRIPKEGSSVSILAPVVVLAPLTPSSAAACANWRAVAAQFGPSSLSNACACRETLCCAGKRKEARKTSTKAAVGSPLLPLASSPCTLFCKCAPKPAASPSICSGLLPSPPAKARRRSASRRAPKDSRTALREQSSDNKPNFRSATASARCKTQAARAPAPRNGALTLRNSSSRFLNNSGVSSMSDKVNSNKATSSNSPCASARLGRACATSFKDGGKTFDRCKLGAALRGLTGAGVGWAAGDLLRPADLHRMADFVAFTAAWSCTEASAESGLCFRSRSC
mmetsp:Transcript_15525/g.34503  ORF Transcript_15525/g.34503 Transcript_15525/m.34503 type:complete len:404 (+) Transcript_15525:146-1357(+)